MKYDCYRDLRGACLPFTTAGRSVGQRSVDKGSPSRELAARPQCGGGSPSRNHCCLGRFIALSLLQLRHTCLPNSQDSARSEIDPTQQGQAAVSPAAAVQMGLKFPLAYE